MCISIEFHITDQPGPNQSSNGGSNGCVYASSRNDGWKELAHLFHLAVELQILQPALPAGTAIPTEEGIGVD